MLRGKFWKSMLTLTAAAGLVGGVAFAGHHGDHGEKMDKDHESKVKIGHEAPDFSLESVGGEEFTLSKQEGKIVVLEWTNPGCPFVVKHNKAKTIPTLMDKYEEKDIVWVQINSTNSDHKDFLKPEDYKKVIEDHGIKSKVLYDDKGKVGKMYGAKTTPHIFIVDAEGKLAYMGAMDDNPSPKYSGDETNYVHKALAALVEGEPVKKSSTKPYGCSVKYAKK